MFEGVYTAIVTPFDENGRADLDAFRRLIELQIEGGVDGIVPVGTTGESPTLNFEEHKEVIQAAVEAAAGKIKVIAGTGGNATAEALELTSHANEIGADGTLQVTPYYNKPSQRGLIEHFTRVADVGLPVVLYNIPGRTSLPIELETVIELARHENIVAIKEAAGDVNAVSRYHRECDLEVLSGDDALTLPKMIVGGVGVISVASNIIPRSMADLVHAALNKEWEKARELHDKYHRLFTDLFIDTNPVPIKAALAMQGLIREGCRLPMCVMSDEDKSKLRATLEHYGLLA